jgi:glycosyltransferase involved in cell wall biosynthesis
MKSSKTLLLIGSTKGSVHVKNYYNLIKDYFDEILIVSNYSIDFCESKTVNFSLTNPLKVLRSIKQLRKIINEYNPSVIHVHQANSFAYITAKANKSNIPLVLTTWGSDVLILPQKGFLYKHIAKYSVKKADYITADANFMVDAIKKLGVKKEVLLANFGIDYNEIIIPQKENIIYSNRLHNDLYNVDKIIEAFAGFVKDNPSWKLVVGASGSNTDALKKLAKDILPSNSFEFIGFVDKDENKRQYLRAKIWISIPSSDGTAISLLEAMGYGCIPVLSDLPANKEWVLDMDNGCIVKESVLDSIKSALTLSLQQVQEKNKKIIINKATKQVNKTKFESLYDSVIN